VSTVGGEDGGAYVSADLCSAQRSWPAAALPSLQGARRAVPSLMPPRDGGAAAGDAMAGSECGEAACSVVWSVLEEDVVLAVRAGVRHGEALGRGEEWRRLRQRAALVGAKSGLSCGMSLPLARQQEDPRQQHV
jgi:hypothetical protein